MIGRLIAIEHLKSRRTFVRGLIVLGPFGVVALQTLHFALRFDYLTERYKEDLWSAWIDANLTLSAPTLMMGLAIVASMLAGYEHQTNAWKQTLALPVPRAAAFGAKFLYAAALLAAASAMLAGGTAAAGFLFGFGAQPLPLEALLAPTYVSYAAALPFLALQLWLSVAIENQAMPLTVGVLGAVVTMFSFNLPEWMPWRWLYALEGSWSYATTVGLSLAAGAMLYVAGTVHFARKDVV
ncbi:ABC transporter permease [Paenibacillus sp. TRM 82003]|nr:ABC transporter permease [Paenibacillus sp. TRM 82003]